jgi:hypothetical protein
MDFLMFNSLPMSTVHIYPNKNHNKLRFRQFCRSCKLTLSCFNPDQDELEPIDVFRCTGNPVITENSIIKQVKSHLHVRFGI